MEWIKLEDKKPENEICVLISGKSTRNQWNFIKLARRINDAWLDDEAGELISRDGYNITHWMPLPNPPKN